MWKKIAFASACAAVCLGAHAGEPPAVEAPADASQADDSIATVVVASVRNPALKPYRIMSAGLDAFDEFRHLAPNAVLKFELDKPELAGASKTDWNRVTLRIAGDTLSLPVPIASDGTFTLPRSQQAYDEGADLVTNQKKGAVAFAPRVYTPGLPEYTRRLGDFRLECQVLMAIGKKELGLGQRMMFTTMFGTSDWCSAKRAQIASVRPEWPIRITQINGAQRREIPAQGHRFFAPIQDKSLSDDTLYEFEFWSKATPERRRQYIAQQPLSVKTSMNKWREGTALEADGNHVYKARMALQPGEWKFNFESAGREIAFGANAGMLSASPGVTHPLIWHGAQRLTFKVEQAGQYDFSLDLQDLDRPAVTISRAN